jgi:tRNA U34 5-methylaminomethyl-2-thiouridine-forming methyltransferase MnmC
LDLSKNRKIIITKDGSHSMLVPELDEQYHSIHGAVQEAKHVFLKMGLGDYLHQTGGPINVFELGFGTGLNAFLSAQWASINQQIINYTSIEKYPLSKGEFQQLNYGDFVGEKKLYQKINTSKWNEFIQISKCFKLRKLELDLIEDQTPSGFDLIFFDAFAPNKQPQLWEVSIFEKMHSILNPKGFLVTYCCQGQARRNMISAGFSVQKVPGPPGKREMLKATKL